ncbi:glycosyltransferase family 4 protein [Halotia branconii]|uniref:Glycosyltransferase family 4 protein n=1 Tax=Halotia branconii CENA392 TaxID=1539056 RepID=A0AAJ6NP07_9CYAN|nr:glycosyltransferase family 4 protein [Halotia branconii]WGV24073.1 glycosyltransferase family 4 protein [Halotia branconii CENA392]
MKIFIYSSVFYPNIGGLETVMFNLAHEFVAHGHDIKLATQTTTNEVDNFPFEIIRCPTVYELLQLTLWCDICFHACVSLKAVWPVLLLKKPLVITHQTWYSYPGTKQTWQAALKHWITHFSTNIAPSQAIADQLPASVKVIPNSYEDDVFYIMPEISRDRDLVFLGRLVSDKGADLLLDSLALLKQQGLEPNLTIIGQGPEELALKQQAQTLGIAEQIQFIGTQRGETLARLLNAHKIIVVPSKWQEPFGIVALEGIACGCLVVGSSSGGLKDAIGSCGVTFPNGSVEYLTKVLTEVLINIEKSDTHNKHRKSHLIRHYKSSVAKAYLQVMEAIVQ